MTLDKYFLIDKIPVKWPGTLEQWSEWHYGENAVENRRVAGTQVGPYWVSTVFLGMDHNFGAQGQPVLFETMVFKGKESDLWCERACTWQQAEEKHKEAIKWVEADMNGEHNDVSGNT